MKKRSRNQPLRKKKEFRFHNVDVITSGNQIRKIRHPAYIFFEKGNIFIYVSITHSNNVNNYLVIKLNKNPNPQDKRDSYWVAEIKKDTKDRFSRRQEKWKIDQIDDESIREFYKKR